MRLILTDDVYNLGTRGEVVDVAAGYGRNYLLPKGLALPATPGNLKMVEQQRVAIAKKEAVLKEEAELLAKELVKLHLIVSRKAGDTGTLFGSVTSKDLADLLEQNGIHLDRRRIALDHPIKSLGNVMVDVHPHVGVDARLLVSVLPEEDEPVARVMERGVDSDQIYEDLEAKVKAIKAREEGVRPDLMEEPETETEEEVPSDLERAGD